MTHLVAAIDLGSNSFHVTLVDASETPYRVVSRAGEKIQLAAGLNEDNYLSQSAIDRGLECLSRLAPKLAQVDPKNRHVVATNTLRVATNRDDFIKPASVILGVQVQVITGEQEASLIFCGVVGEMLNTVHQNSKKLVIDIGGGSTELIVGQQTPTQLDSFPMGCVTFSQAYFPNRAITPKALQSAVDAAQTTIHQAVNKYKSCGWGVCIGSSGTIKALVGLSGLKEAGVCYLDWVSMANIEEMILTFKTLDQVAIDGLRPDRGEVLPAGYAILKGIMLNLGLDRIYFSTGALREGVLLNACTRGV
ncbi:MAG: Ppx/GppA family phosphatase [Gammaproteobacteria bacterium]|nr:Ppx/GppA family phosphatase [Gammaproteobacteria bacterium]